MNVGRVFAGTWNVAAGPPTQPVNPWLFPPEMGGEPDIYVIGYARMSLVVWHVAAFSFLDV